jgi:hypothetical protein
VNKWTKNEVNILVENYLTKSKEEIIGLIHDKSWNKVMSKARKLGLRRKFNSQLWLELEDDIVKKYYLIFQKEKIMPLLPTRGWPAIKARAAMFKLYKVNHLIRGSNHWSDNEKKLLKENYEHMNRKELLELIHGRTWISLSKVAGRMNLRRQPFRIQIWRDKWSDKEDNIIKEYYLKSEKCELLKLIPDRSWKGIRKRANLFGLKRKEYKIYCKIEKLLLETPIAYYWIGFLLADGHFVDHIIQLGLAEKDSSHVEKFKKYIDYNGNSRSNGIGISDSVIPQIIKKFNISNRKTYDPPDLLWIKDKDLLFSLIVGFIDGDGCIGKRKDNNKPRLMIGVYESWINNMIFFHNFLFEISGYTTTVIPIINHNKKAAILDIGDNRVLAFMKKKVIDLKLPVMKRKWDKIDENYISPELLLVDKIKEIQKLTMVKTEIAKQAGISYGKLYKLYDKYKGVLDERKKISQSC